MESSFSTALAFTLAEEGDLSLDARDGGCFVSGVPGDGPLIGSKWGISAAALAEWLRPDAITAAAMRALDRATVEAIYRTHFWLPIAGGQLPAGLDLAVMDCAYNAGVSRSARLLQACIGAQADGWIGPATIAAVERAETRALVDRLDADALHGLQQILEVRTDGVFGPQTHRALAARSDAPLLMLISALTASQCAFYRGLADASLYGAGWLARTSRRQIAALRLATKATAPA